jgi:UDP-N-acetylglucosamine 1-carboxyvinyltransferase
MEKLVIKGGKRLSGEVEISGAKNAALPAMAASILAGGQYRLHRVPDLADVRTMGKLLKNLGADFELRNGVLDADTGRIANFEAPYELVKTMRASVLVLGPLVARYGQAKVSLPGGCAIGERPIDLHIMGLEKLGAKISLKSGYVVAKAPRLKGERICFDIPTVTGTENLMMAATLAEGRTILENAAREPEVVSLAEMLNSMGARIRGAGQSIIEVEGVDSLRPVEHRIIPDRIESCTFMAAAAITGGDVLIKGADPGHLEAVILKLRESGVVFEERAGGLRVVGPKRPGANDVKTMPYPGFPTDMQAQFMALMSIAQGTSVIRETIFENRFMHVAELKRMGADINVQAGVATVRGVKELRAAEIMATDLRASASLVLAALAAKGKSTVHRIYHLDRGYERMDDKLRALGADIERVK